MSYAAIVPTTLSTIGSLTPDVTSQLWDEAVQEGVREKDWSSKFESTGPDSVIMEDENKLTMAGNQVNMTVEAELQGDPVHGSNAAIGNEEAETFYTYSVVVDFKRHSVARDRRMRQFMAGDKAKAQADMSDKATRWMGRFKCSDGLMTLRTKLAFTTSGQASNLFYAGGGSSDADLTKNSILDTSFFEAGRQKLAGLGAQPADLVQNDNGEAVSNFVMWATSRSLLGLANDTEWKSFQLTARAREGTAFENNPLITGSYGTWRGVRAYEVPVPDHDNQKMGAVGSPLEPRAFLRTATTTTTGTTINGGGSGSTSTAILYFKWFPGYDYQFTSSQSASSDTNVYYAMIYNLPGSTDAGKYEVIQYTGNSGSNGNQGNNLVAVTRGVNSGDAQNYSASHDVGSLIVPCNVNGIPYAYVLMLGKRALLRAYGGDPDGSASGSGRERLDFEYQDYKFITGACISSVFGQAVPIRTDGKYMNAVIGKVAIQPWL